MSTANSLYQAPVTGPGTRRDLGEPSSAFSRASLGTAVPTTVSHRPACADSSLFVHSNCFPSALRRSRPRARASSRATPRTPWSAAARCTARRPSATSTRKA
ncbi:hypothetical protein LV779_34575 [Streptomyces thinghirensis]|nr:hypothetical protein [Streptomyces thinghirensis]